MKLKDNQPRHKTVSNRLKSSKKTGTQQNARKSRLVQNGRLMLFYNGFFNNTRKSWSKGNTSAQEKKADGRWKKISGEVAPKQPARKGQGRGR